MTYLELCQKLMRRAGIPGVLTSVVNQAGELLRVTDWVAEGYRFVLNLHSDWEFLRAPVQFDVDTVNAIYTPAATGVAEFGEWRVVNSDWRTRMAGSDGYDEQFMSYMDYDAFRATYDFGASRLQKGRPLVFTVRPDQSLQFWPQPDAIYTVVGEQFRYPADLAANGDVPTFKAKFHDAVVYRALMLYAEYEEAGSVHAAAQGELARIVAQLEDAYMPKWQPSEPLA